MSLCSKGEVTQGDPLDNFKGETGHTCRRKWLGIGFNPVINDLIKRGLRNKTLKTSEIQGALCW